MLVTEFSKCQNKLIRKVLQAVMCNVFSSLNTLARKHLAFYESRWLLTIQACPVSYPLNMVTGQHDWPTGEFK